QELLELGEGDDLVEFAVDLGLPHAEDDAVEIDVLAAGELGVESGADLQERGEPAAEPGGTRGRFDDPAEDLQEGGLAGPLAADDSDDLAPPDPEGDVLQGPERVVPRPLGAPDAPEGLAGGPERGRDAVAQRGRAVGGYPAPPAQAVLLADPLADDHLF